LCRFACSAIIQFMEPEIFKYQADEPKPSLGNHLVDFVQTLVVFAAIASAIYWQVAQPHKVSGSSMYPNFHNGDYIITDKLSYKFGHPKRGDVIVLKNPKDTSVDFIKRIIGTPGDRVKVADGHVYINGEMLKESYLNPSILTPSGAFIQEGEEVTVGPNEYLVFGDNRTASSDSREWGYLPKEDIIGRVIFRYWPSDAIGFNPAAAKY
jgi:signal peptidase I